MYVQINPCVTLCLKLRKNPGMLLTVSCEMVVCDDGDSDENNDNGRNGENSNDDELMI